MAFPRVRTRNYASSLPIRLEAADMVIFVDLLGWTCLCGIAHIAQARLAASSCR
jgi:hypothetical protein